VIFGGFPPQSFFSKVCENSHFLVKVAALLER